jgi:acetoacetyl-CoA reductase/3-oxoacyl-[acyl-carrier protein] reductase
MNDRVVLVTGASRGIGRAVAEALLAAGCRVAFGFHRQEAAAQELVAGRERAFAVRIDVSDPGSVSTAIAAVQARLGQIDILVNNAGYSQLKPFAELSDTDWEAMLSVHLLGAVRCVRACLPGMIDRGFGRIVNMASVGGQWGGVNQLHYAAAKAALINFTRSLARLHSRDGITANAVAPGLIETEMVREELARSHSGPAGAAAAIPVGRIGLPEEVAAAVVYLCSDAAAFVSGHTLNVNGGVYFG